MSNSDHTKKQQSSSNVHILTDTSSLNKSDDEKSKQHQSIRMDEHGNLIDQDGNVIHVTAKYTPTLSVNKKQQQQQQQHRRTTTASSSNIAKTTSTAAATAQQKKRTLMDFYDEAMQEESRKRSKQFHNHHHQKHGQHGQQQQQEEINNIMGTRKRRPLMLQFHEPGEFEQLEQRIEQQREQQLEQERQQKQFELDLEVRRQYMNEQNKKWIQYQNDQMNQMKSTVHLYMGMKPVVLSVDEYLNASLHSKQQQQGEENKLKKNSTSGDDHSNGSGSGTDGGGGGGGDSDDVELKRMLQSSLIVPHSVIEQSKPPGIEWWDQLVLPVKQFEENKELDQLTYDDFVVVNEQQQNEPPLFQLHEKRVTRNLIEHDVPLSNESLDQHLNQTIIMPLMMTARERKRLKTQQRLEREREKQLKIRQGLIPAPAPKANLKNFMKVYMNDGTQDPTKLEKKIIQEIEQRKKNHDMRNEEKKLTWEQKKAKREEKLGADESNELVCVIYRIPDNGAALSHPQNRFKLNTNAKQFKISGTIILFNGASEGTNGLLIAEGGAKAVKKFCHVIENRIGWNLRFNKGKENATDNHDGNMETNDDENDDDEDDDQEKSGKCQFMWKGTIENRSFKFFKSQQLFSDESTARNSLNCFGIAHYMDHLS